MKNHKIISAIENAWNAMFELWANLDEYPEKKNEVSKALDIFRQWREYLDGEK